MRAQVGLIVCVLAVAVLVLAALALLRLHGPLDRVHAVTVSTSLGLPLLTIGLAIRDGSLHGVAKLLLTGALVAVTGPALSTATARAAVARERGRGGG